VVIDPLRRRFDWRAIGVIAVIVGGLVVLGFGIRFFQRALQTTACDDVEFRQPAQPSDTTPAPPPISQGPLVRALRVVFGRSSPAVFCDDFPDPFVLRVESTYYAFSTQSDDMHIPVLTAGGLFGTGTRHDALPELPAWTDGQRVWAPSVLPVGGRYVMYYAASVHGRPGECLSRAVADEPAGPYVDNSTAPFVCPSPGGAIDPSPFLDSNGAAYLLWKNYGDVTGIVVAQLSADRLSLTGSRTLVLEADQPWEAGIVEAPSMVKRGNSYFLFYSGNEWQSDRYAIGYAACGRPAGACSKAAGPWLGSSTKAQGPGGQEFFTDTSGRLWMTLHAWIDGKIGYPFGARALFALPIQFRNGAPVAG
jgi:beta-xylosidase